jgi:hypothetical protein
MKLKNNDMVGLIEDKKEIMSHYANRETRRQMFKIYKAWVKSQIREGHNDWSIEKWDTSK